MRNVTLTSITTEARHFFTTNFVLPSRVKKGILTSNISTGGKAVFIHKDQVPKQVLKEVKMVDSKLKHYKPRLYAMDFVIDKNNKVWMIEMNSKPGFFFYSEYAQHKRQEKFEKTLIKIVRDSV